MRKKIKILLKIILTIFLFYLIFKNIDFNKFIQIISNANIIYFIFICFLWPIGLFLSSYKWGLILKEYGINISQRKSFCFYWIGSFFNNFLPTSFGGDSYKFVYLNREFKNKKAQIFSSILLERGIGFLVIIFFSLFFSIFVNKKLFYYNTFISFIVLIIFLIFLMFIIFAKKSIKIRKPFNLELLNKIIKVYNILVSFNDRKTLAISFITSSIFLLLSVFSTSLAFKAFHYETSFLLLLFLMPLLQLVGLFPFTINSLGLQEGIGIYLFFIFGIDKEIVLSVLLVSRILLGLCTVTGGLKFLTYK